MTEPSPTSCKYNMDSYCKQGNIDVCKEAPHNSCTFPSGTLKNGQSCNVVCTEAAGYAKGQQGTLHCTADASGPTAWFDSPCVASAGPGDFPPIPPLPPLPPLRPGSRPGSQQSTSTVAMVLTITAASIVSIILIILLYLAFK